MRKNYQCYLLFLLLLLKLESNNLVTFGESLINKCEKKKWRRKLKTKLKEKKKFKLLRQIYKHTYLPYIRSCSCLQRQMG